MLGCLLLLALAQPGAVTPTRSATLLDERPTTTQLVVRALLAPVSAAIGTGTGIGIGSAIGFGLGSLVDALSPPPPGELTAVSRLLMVGLVIGAVVGYLLGSTSPGQLFETSRRARGWAVLWGALVTALTGAACLLAVVTGVFLPALPWLIAGGATLAIAVPVFSDLTRPRAEGVTVARF